MSILKKYLPYLLLAFGFFIISVPLWLKMDLLPIRLWDEARNAVNALEMSQSHNWLIRTYNGFPETFETKPPLLIWFQVVSLKMFGYNELAIRMPSVVFSILSLVLLYVLIFKMTGNKLASFGGSLITATSKGFYGEHLGRFGDHEPLLVLISLFLLLQVYLYSKSQKTKHIYYIAFAFCLGVFCKSIAIGLLMPGIFLYLLYDKKIKTILSSRHFYIALAITVLPIATYYGYREQIQPGYLEAVWHGELFPRFFNTSKNFTFADHDYGFYFDQIKKYRFIHWVWALPMALIVPIVLRKAPKEWVFWIINSLVFLLIISKGTKHDWYLAPAIPMMAGAIATSSFLLINFKPKYLIWLLMPLGFLGLKSYDRAYTYAMHPEEIYNEWQTYGISYFLKDEKKASQLTSNTKIVLDSNSVYEPHAFYIKKLKIEQDIKIDRILYSDIKPQDTILLSHQVVFDVLKGGYAVSVLDSNSYGAKLVAIAAKDTIALLEVVSID
jgi:4-amino-4-deoxy-L-arabinose transferase-like glycosyltransferase